MVQPVFRASKAALATPPAVLYFELPPCHVTAVLVLSASVLISNCDHVSVGSVTLIKQLTPVVIDANERSGNDVREEQLNHVTEKLVPELVSISGNDVRDEQLNQAWAKLVPELVSISENDVRDEQLSQAWIKLVPELVSISGNDVRDEQSRQAWTKLVPELVSISGNEVSEVQLSQAWAKLVTVPLFGKSLAVILRFEQPR